MMQPRSHTHSETLWKIPTRNVCVCLCARLLCMHAASHRAKWDDVFLLRFTDLFLYWCSKMSLQSHSCTHGKHITRTFLRHWKYLAIFTKTSLSFLLPFFTLQQSQEWLSHPCKDVCVSVCVWERGRERAREKEMKQAHLQRSSWRIPVRVGDSGRGWEPSQSEGTNLTQALSNTKANKNSRCFFVRK